MISFFPQIWRRWKDALIWERSVHGVYGTWISQRRDRLSLGFFGSVHSFWSFPSLCLSAHLSMPVHHSFPMSSCRWFDPTLSRIFWYIDCFLSSFPTRWKDSTFPISTTTTHAQSVHGENNILELGYHKRKNVLVRKIFIGSIHPSIHPSIPLGHSQVCIVSPNASFRFLSRNATVNHTHAYTPSTRQSMEGGWLVFFLWGGGNLNQPGFE